MGRLSWICLTPDAALVKITLLDISRKTDFISCSKVVVTKLDLHIIGKFPARCGLAVFSGLVYALAFPPVGWRWLVLPGVLGLLISLKGQRGSRARMIGFLHGFTGIAVGLSWVWNLFDALAIPLWCTLAVFTALFAEMQSRAEQRGWSGWKFAVFTALNWGAWEFIKSEIFPLKMPWMSAGLAIGPNVLLPWIGVYGVSLLVIVCAAYGSLRMWKPCFAVLAVWVAVVSFSRPLPAPISDDPSTVSVAGLQLEGVSLTEFLLGTEKIPAGVEHVVWPEYAVPFDIHAYPRDWALLLDLCRRKGITLTFGTQSKRSGGDAWRNLAMTVDPTGYLGEHTKVHTVHFFDDGTPGTTTLPVGTTLGKVGTPICFDCDYEGIVRKMTAAGAGYFVVPTMDAASWSARQHDQHAELTRIRAAENARWIFVTATSGISQIIDPNGHLHARLGAMEQGSIRGTLKRETRLTFYTRFGWLAAWVVLGVAAIAWIRLLIPCRKPQGGGLDPCGG